jgi:hypothetical protein
VTGNDLVEGLVEDLVKGLVEDLVEDLAEVRTSQFIVNFDLLS